jgi:uncharacterized membrane protein
LISSATDLSRRLTWTLMLLLSLLVAVYAIGVLTVPVMRPPFIRDRMTYAPLAVYLHLGASAVAIALGPFQFVAKIRARAVHVHRWIGRAYLIAIIIGGLSAFVLATMSQGGMVAHVGFALLAIVWIVTSIAAYRAIRRRDIVSHRRWMTRSFALTLAAVTLRIYLPLSLAAGAPFEIAYPAIAWCCWIPNLLFAEWRLIGPLKRHKTMPVTVTKLPGAELGT